LVARALVALVAVSGVIVASAPAIAADGTSDTSAKKGKKEASAAERYETGLRAMKRGYYTKALEEFNHVRNYYRDDPISVKAELAIADVHFKKRDFEQARLAFEDFARLHPRHEDLDYVTWRIGLCLYQRASKAAGRDQTTTKQAVNAWAGFDVRFPDSEHKLEVEELAGKSRDRLAAKELFIGTYYAEKGVWVAARKRAEHVLDRYPESSKVPDALALLARAQHAWGLEDEARATRERLAEVALTSEGASVNRSLAKVDRFLARPPGSPPVVETFPRPYRMPGGAAAGPTPGGP
jgi:outer membrane protein assembly factor BamD